MVICHSAEVVGERTGGVRVATQRHIVQLDSLRGLAAFTVLIHHLDLTVHTVDGPFSYAQQWYHQVHRPPFSFIFAGHEAVVLFFVLSGFVLYLPYRRGNDPTYGAFVIRRICRIWIPYAVVVTIALAARALLYHGPVDQLGPWFNEVWKHVDIGDVLQHYAMLGVFNAAVLIPVLWSLVQEMRISLVYPVLAKAVRRWSPLVVAAVGLGILAFGLMVIGAVHERGEDVDIWETLLYSGCFVLGALLARCQDRVVASIEKLPWFVAIGGFLVCLGAFELTPWLPGPLKATADIVITLGALGLIAFGIGSAPLRSVLARRPVVWLGKVSYSVYLIHMVVILVVMRLWVGTVSMWILFAVSIVLTLVAAELLHRWVEIPAIRLGRRLTQKDRARAGNSDLTPEQARS